MKNVLIFDVETTGLDPEQCRIVEVGYVLWSVEHGILEVYSSLLPAESNDASLHNGIDPAACEADAELVWMQVETAASRADAAVAHFAEFDRSFVLASAARGEAVAPGLIGGDWICTAEDFMWPVACPRRSLIEIALCHGVGVVSSHRSIHDCLTLARMFERVGDSTQRLDLALQRSRRPKAMFVSLEPYEMKDVVKAAGFKWDPPMLVEGKRVWYRKLAVEDAAALPFRVAQT